MKRYMLFALILVVLISSCSRIPNKNAPDNTFPTPTSYPLFSSKGTPEPEQTLNARATPQTPTVAGFFQQLGSVTPSPTSRSKETAAPNVPVSRTQDPNSRAITIYDDALNPNWQILKSERTQADPENNQTVYQGTKSIKITPGEDFSPVLFAVRPNASEMYPRDAVLGIEFMLSPGNGTIEPKNLGVTVVGSNKYTYYVPGDTSVTNKVDPVFPETRLYYLGINQMIPPQTWVDVTVWMDDLVYDPIYNSVTGFYIKNDAGFRDTFYIDDVRIIVLGGEQASGQTNGEAASGEATPAVTTTPNPDDLVKSIQVNVDAKQNTHPISPMIYGVSNASTQTLQDLKPGLNNWGGNANERYNWQLGNAWNAGRDNLYQNTDLGQPAGSSIDRFILQSTSANVATRISLPTLGWVARNTNARTCSFPQADGSCGNANDASCLNPGEIADPTLANVPTDVKSISEWVRHMVTTNSRVNIFALGNEPELWGITHYDVHPKCTTYQEIVNTYLQYALPIRQLAPSVTLAGPVTSGWNYYWNSAAGAKDKQQNGNEDFIPWFLDQLKKHDTEKGVQTINVLDIHYYPEGLYNKNVDPETAAHRMRATRSLWDPSYIDESPISAAVNLIPRMKEIIAGHYPGLQLGISEWNFGAEENINGALAIADVLGIFGREDVYYASYWAYPPKGSPGAFAFRMYTNYDGVGGKFGDLSVMAKSDNPNLVGAYAALDQRTKQLHLIVINKHPKNTLQVKLNIANFATPKKVTLYQYSREDISKVIKSDVQWPPKDLTLSLSPYSINHFVLNP